MAYNTFMKVNFSIPKGINKPLVKTLVEEETENVERVYSYLVHVKDDAFVVQLNINQEEIYNVIVTKDVIGEIVEAITTYSNKDDRDIISYKQPPLDIMIQLYEPLICSLAIKQHDRWKELEYEDLCQMCRMTMIKLYGSGYYIHKSLLVKSFNNAVLMSLRSERDKPAMCSLDDKIVVSKDGDTSTIAETLVDTSYDDEREANERREFIQKVFDEVKEVIVGIIGVRQFEELLRDYGNKHTNEWSRSTMHKLKNKFKKLGIDWKSFDKYL